MERTLIRRRLLELASIGLAGAVTGCLSGDSGRDEPTQSPTTSTTAIPFEPPMVRVHNRTEEPQQLLLRVLDEDQTTFEQEITVEAEEIEHYDPGIDAEGTYTVEVEHEGTTSSFPFSVGQFGFNMIVEIRRDGVTLMQEE